MNGIDTNWRFGLDYERRSSTFFEISPNALVAVDYQSRTDAQVSRRFGWRIFAGVGSAYEEGFEGVMNRRIDRATLMLALGRRLRLELAGFRTTQVDFNEDRGLATLTWSDEPGRYSTSAYYDSLQHTSAVQLNRTNERPDRDWRGNVSYQNHDMVKTAGLSLEGLAPFASARVDHFSQEAVTGRTRTSNLGVQTALVWVGTEFAISQPVNDAFVMVKAVNLPADHHITVNPDAFGGRAQVTPSSKAVLRDLSSYTLFFVNLDATLLPPGYLLDQECYRVRPSYRSGLLITADFTRKIMVKGRLLLPNGKPAALITGDLSDSSGKLIDNSFFTNREGVFVFEGLEPGAYVLITEKSTAPLRFTVGAEIGQVLDLGVIKIIR
jgi:outer membrane usher protein